MSSFAEAVVRDLRAFAVELLEPGLAPVTPGAHDATPGAGGFGALLRRIEAMAVLVPSLLAQVETDELSTREEPYASVLPLRATLPRSPADYLRRGSELVPARWTTWRAIPQPDPWPLAWLLHLLALLRIQHQHARGRVAKQVEEARRIRRGDSAFAAADRDALQALETSFVRAERLLSSAERSIHESAGLSLAPSPVSPRPLPRGPAWAYLRRLADPVLRPAAALLEILRGMLDPAATVAELPYLYQRWCGIKIVQALQALGLQARDESALPLLLGGKVRLTLGDTEVVLWCEPRYTRERDHDSGLYALRGESTPDFVLVVPGPDGSDAFVLDPTIDPRQENCSPKGRYRGELAFRTLRRVAGVPTLHHPLRAWAAAPLESRHCRMESADGAYGTVPMLPQDFTAAPLIAWLADIVAHARAWTRRSG